MAEIPKIRLAKKEEIPKELTDVNCWILWSYSLTAKGDLTKVPCAPWRTGGDVEGSKWYKVSAYDPENWVAFDFAENWAKKREGEVGLGFVFNKGVYVAGIDLDNCLDGETLTTEIAEDVVDAAGSYIEISPSGKGLHVIVKERVKRKAALVNHEAEVEVYDDERYFAITGVKWPTAPNILTENEGLLDNLYQKYTKGRFEELPEELAGKQYFPIEKLFSEEWLKAAKKSGDLRIGPHPVHGSERSGTNFVVNLREGWWRCRKHNVGGHAVELLAVTENMIECEKLGKKGHRLVGEVLQRAFARALALKLIEGGAYSRSTFFNDDNQFVPVWLADDVSKCFKFNTHRQSKEIYVEENGVSLPKGEEVIREECRKRLGDQAKGWYVNEVVKHITETTYTEPERFNPPANLLNTESGPLDLDTLEIVPVPDDVIFINKIPVKHDTAATCPTIDKFFKEVLHPDDISLMQEIVGYCLLRGYPYHRAFMFKGPGGNGKSTTLNLIRALLGANNTGTVSLQELIYDRFSKSELFGKMANLYADIPSTKLTETGTFKMLVGEDMIRGQQKHKDAFDFWNYAKQFFSANELPPTNDISEAWWRRWILIDFSNSFPEGDSRTDPHLLEKMTTPEELSGLLNWALKGLKRLLKNNKFAVTKSRSDIEKTWIAQTDSLRAFLFEFAEYNKDTAVVKDGLMEQYGAYCADNDLLMIDSSYVGKRLPTLMPRVGKFKPTIGNKQRPAWHGLCLKPPYFKDYVYEQEKAPQSTLANNDDSKGIKGKDLIIWVLAKEYVVPSKEEGVHSTNKPIDLDTPDTPPPATPSPYNETSPTVVEYLAEIPEIVGIDGETYGPCAIGTISTLPRANAVLLAGKGMVKILIKGGVKK